MDRHPRWTLGIADPSLIGWATVVAYLLCAILLARTARQAREERHLWWLAMALVLALGINKQLDLQTWLTQTMRDIFVRGGWYEWRRLAQALFVTGATIGAGTIGVWALRMAGRSSLAIRRCMVGCAILITYILMRLATIHHAGLPGAIAGRESIVPPVLEFAGITIIAWSTHRRQR